MAAAHGHVRSFLFLSVALFRLLFKLVQIPFQVVSSGASGFSLLNEIGL